MDRKFGYTRGTWALSTTPSKNCILVDKGNDCAVEIAAVYRHEIQDALPESEAEQNAILIMTAPILLEEAQKLTELIPELLKESIKGGSTFDDVFLKRLMSSLIPLQFYLSKNATSVSSRPVKKNRNG